MTAEQGRALSATFPSKKFSCEDNEIIGAGKKKHKMTADRPKPMQLFLSLKVRRIPAEGCWIDIWLTRQARFSRPDEWPRRARYRRLNELVPIIALSGPRWQRNYL
jgi:hypothetical protein